MLAYSIVSAVKAQISSLDSESIASEAGRDSPQLKQLARNSCICIRSFLAETSVLLTPSSGNRSSHIFL
jgi:hypothetical protein